MNAAVGAFFARSHRSVLVLVGLALGAVVGQFHYGMIEGALYDLRMRLGWLRPSPTLERARHRAHPPLRLVVIDEDTLRSLGERAPLTLEFHARLLERLATLGPSAVGLLVDFGGVHALDPAQFAGPWAERLIAAATRLRAEGRPVWVRSLPTAQGEVAPPFPLSTLPLGVASLGAAVASLAEQSPALTRAPYGLGSDRVSRRALIRFDGRDSLALKMARHIHPELESIADADTESVYFRWDPASARTTARDLISARAVLEGRASALAELRGATVLVGTLNRIDAQDFVLAPLSGLVESGTTAAPLLVAQAQLVQALSEGRLLRPLDPLIGRLITLVIVCAVFAAVVALAPLQGLLAAAATIGAFVLASVLAFAIAGVWVEMSTPLVGALIAYYLTVPYRLIAEHRRRWAMEREHQLLRQVEELKSNFLSLVTHDLKTPIARIQGLLAVVRHKLGQRLAPAETTALEHAIAGAQELNQFVSTLLELNRIESGRFSIRPESRDINPLIERAAERLRPHAESRQITLALALTPLFPISVDSELITKVLINLIDNGIKYSQPGGRVVIESRELADGSVEVSIEDHGLGIAAQDRALIFGKFFRSKDAHIQRVSGSGVGLYLSRYFVEAHGGQLELDDTRTGGGSRFVLRLPIQTPSVLPRALTRSHQQSAPAKESTP